MRLAFGVLAVALSAGPAPAQKWFDKAVTKVEAAFTPAEAKPGQAVTLRVTVHLAPGYHTYPLVQPDKAAAGMVNKFTLPPADGLVPVGSPLDPAEFKTKAEPLLGITELRYLPGAVVYEHAVVVSPKAAAGAVTVKPTLKLSVCDADNCFPPKAVTPEATLKVLPGPAVEVPAAYRDAVKKAVGE